MEGFTFGDIRPVNINLDHNLNVKLSENLTSCNLPLTPFFTSGKCYCSPEMYYVTMHHDKDYVYDKYKADVFSMGMCILEAGLMEYPKDIYEEKKVR